MKRVLWLLLLGVLATACSRRQPAPAELEVPAAVDIAPKQSATVKAANATDQAVNVRGPATVFVIQDHRVRAIFELSHRGLGTFSVPLKAIVDGSNEDLHIGVMETPMPEALGDSMCWTMCPNCIIPGDCCPRH